MIYWRHIRRLNTNNTQEDSKRPREYQQPMEDQNSLILIMVTIGIYEVTYDKLSHKDLFTAIKLTF